MAITTIKVNPVVVTSAATTTTKAWATRAELAIPPEKKMVTDVSMPEPSIKIKDAGFRPKYTQTSQTPT